MSAKIHSALFDLIQSMTKSEKRYFKVISSRHTIGEENNYVRIFDYLEQAAYYDEELLFEHFKGEAFLNRFSITKKRLYDHVLAALDAYHAEKSNSAQLFKMIHSAEILYNKSLYDQSRRVLNSAEKQALKQENELACALIYDLQKKIIETIGYTCAPEEEVDRLVDSYTIAIKKASYSNELWSIKGKLFRQLIVKGIARNDDDKRTYSELCNPILGDIALNELSSSAVYLINHIRSVYFYAIGELEQSYRYLQKSLDHFDQIDHFRESEPQKYISVLTNATYIADRLGKHMEALKLLSILKSLSSDLELNEDLNIKTFTAYESIMLSLEIRMGKINDSLDRLPIIDNQLNLWRDKINPTRYAYILFKTAVVNFTSGNYSEALKRINRLLNDSNFDSNEDLIAFTYMLELLTYIETDKDELLKYKLKSVERFMKKHERRHPMEVSVLKFVSNYSKIQDKFERHDEMEKLKTQLNTIIQNTPAASLLMDYFDVLAWVNSKLYNKSLSTCLSENYNLNMRNAS